MCNSKNTAEVEEQLSAENFLDASIWDRLGKYKFSIERAAALLGYDPDERRKIRRRISGCWGEFEDEVEGLSLRELYESIPHVESEKLPLYLVEGWEWTEGARVVEIRSRLDRIEYLVDWGRWRLPICWDSLFRHRERHLKGMDGVRSFHYIKINLSGLKVSIQKHERHEIHYYKYDEDYGKRLIQKETYFRVPFREFLRGAYLSQEAFWGQE